MHKFFLYVFIISLLLIASADAKVFNVLIINSYHVGMPWEDIINSSIQKQFDESNIDFNIYREYLDTKRFPIPEECYICRKYDNIKIDLTITVDDNALRYLLNHQELMVESNIFCGVNSIALSRKARENGHTGVIESIDIARNIQLIDRINPKIRTLYAVVDSKFDDPERKQQFLSKIKEMNLDYRVEVMSGWTFRSFEKWVKGLASDTVILLFSFEVDAEGGFISESARYSWISSTDAQVYTLWSTHGFGEGIVGGYMTDAKEHGNITARKALAVLSGTASRELDIDYGLSSFYAFDYEQLTRFHISPEVLPYGAQLINLPTLVEKRYRLPLFISSVALFVVACLSSYAIRPLFARMHVDAGVKIIIAAIATIGTIVAAVASHIIPLLIGD